MNYLFINSVYGVRSTGKLIAAKCRELTQQGHKCAVAYGRETMEDANVKQISIGKRRDYLCHAFLSRIMDCQGFLSARATKAFLKELEDFQPDVVWIHNLHGYYLQVEILFTWLKAHPSVKVYWTLHDCWAITGHCSHFTVAKCERWRSGCFRCPQKREYPSSYVLDRSAKNYARKKTAFTGVTDLTIITPSQWLAGLVKQSYLSKYPVIVQENQIDTAIFKPTHGTFRETYHLEHKWIVLGVAVGWEETKGLPDILKLRAKLDDRFVIVLVGMTPRQIRHLPKGILGIERTRNQVELAQIYTAADVFVNPTHQDNYPTVNLEARACGTPVVTYNVGGSPESAGWEHIVEENDIDGLAARIRRLVEKTHEG